MKLKAREEGREITVQFKPDSVSSQNRIACPEKTDCANISVAKDLALSSVSGAANGDQLTVTANVRNLGSNSTSYFYVGFILKQDPSITTNITVLGHVKVSGLAPGAETNVVATFSLPSGLGTGTYILQATADSQGNTWYNQVLESDEKNNESIGNDIVI